MRPTPLLAALTCILATALSAQEAGVTGYWRTPGGAVIRVAPCGNDLCATVIQLEPTAPTRIDSNNPDAAKRNQKLCGLQIGYGFHATDPAHAEDGHLYDPKSGKTYRGTMTSSGDRLSLRGYIGVKAFGRTEQWTRLSTPQETCR